MVIVVSCSLWRLCLWTYRHTRLNLEHVLTGQDTHTFFRGHIKFLALFLESFEVSFLCVVERGYARERALVAGGKVVNRLEEPILMRINLLFEVNHIYVRLRMVMLALP